MTATRAASAVVLLGTALAVPSAARGEKPVLVLAFGGEPAGAHADAPAALTRVMAEAIRESGREVSEANSEDVLTLAGCGEPSDDCLRQALGTLEADAAVTGEVRAADGGVAVELRAITASDPPRTRTVQLRGAATADLAGQFRGEAVAFWRDEQSPAEAAAAAPPEPPTPPPGADLSGGADDTGPSFSASRVQPYAWAIAGTGAGLMVVGSILLLAADGKQDEVDEAPTDTVEQLEHLHDLEESGRSYARWGNVSLVLGGVAAIAGGVLIFKQGRDGGSEASTRVTVTPSAGDGLGAALLLRGGF